MISIDIYNYIHYSRSLMMRMGTKTDEAILCTYSSIRTVQEVVKAMQTQTNTSTSLALVSIILHFDNRSTTTAQHLERVQQSCHYFLTNLRPLVRKTDKVMLLGHTCYFQLFGANVQGGVLVQERLWDALLWRIHNTRDDEIQLPYATTIGHSAYPLPQPDIQQCIAATRVARLSFTRSPIQAQSSQDQQPQSETATDLPIMARQMGVPYLSLLPRRLPVAVKQLMHPQLAQELQCCPLGYEDDTLTVAMLNPVDQLALERLRQETGMRIFPVLASAQELQAVLQQMLC